jgi:hypothetical protein
MQKRVLVVAGTAAIALWAVVLTARQAADPFAFFEPWVKLSASERSHLDQDDVIVRMLPADDGHVAVFAATRLNAPPESLLQWTRAIESFRQGLQVVAVGRFSQPVADSDLDRLVLDEDELNALRKCKVGKCDLKLAAAEIAEVQNAVRATGKGWREAAQRAFRRALIARVRLHQERGLLALPPYADRGRRASVGEAFSAIIARSPYLTRALHWSHDKYGAGRPVINVTYVRLLQRTDPGVPQAMTISTQLFANHYTEGAVGLTAVTCEAPGTCYLAYLNRTQVDFLGGFFGAFKRSAIEGRIESETPNLLRDVRRRLESGSPGSAGEDSLN